ncbi:MAG TPA: sigma-70 family RNA polymerase sigma factor [Fluviicola sp.]|nr:sigma-70 family RNA polymerase sigma factor [Fluviicola sp.]
MEYKDYSDTELVVACKDNIRLAQQELFARFVYMMKGICLRYAQDETEAEDILQDAFIRIFGRLDQYNETGPLGAWIRRITVNTALESYRKRKSVKQQLVTALDLKDLHPATDDGIIEQLHAEELVKKIQQLPPGYRAVFNLYAVEGYSHPEIGELLGISEGTSKSQYSRARLMLRTLIDEESSMEQIRWSYAK